MHRRDPAPRRVIAALATLLALAACAALAVLWLLPSPEAGRAHTESLPNTPGAVSLQSAPQLDLQRYRAQKQAELDRTGADPDAPGFARIPIDRAMTLMTERGLRAGGSAAP